VAIDQKRILMAFSGDGKAIDKNVLVKTIQTLNQHLPGKRLTLTDLLDMEKPGIKGKDNTFFIMDKSELELISQSLPRFMWNRLRLPMLIEMSPDFGSGAARVQGEAEVEVVSKILGKSRPYERQLIIYMPEVRELRRKLPTTTQYAFITNLRDRGVDG
jgi:uncharacterized protein (UPF0216 family)